MDTELRSAGSGKDTVTAYVFAVKGFLRFAESHPVNFCGASRGTAQYVGELQSPTRRTHANVVRTDSGGYLSKPTLRRRPTAVRLLFEFLVERLA